MKRLIAICMAMLLFSSTSCRSKDATAYRKTDEANPSQTAKKMDIIQLSNHFFSVVTDEPELNITHDLNLPKEIDGIQVEWEFSDETLIEPSGKVHRPHEESKYLTMTATFSDGKTSRVEQKKLRVARDMYAGADPDKFPLASRRFEADIKEEMERLWEGTEGPWYIIDSADKIGIFSSTPEEKPWLTRSESNGVWKLASINGKLSQPRIDTAEEAYLLLRTLERATYTQRWIRDVVLDDVDESNDSITYRFYQYYNGVYVHAGHAVVSRSKHYENFSSVSLSFLMIPDDFVTTPDISREEVIEKYDLDSVELMIYEKDGGVYLAYHGIVVRSQQWLFVDAHTGEILHSYSSIVT